MDTSQEGSHKGKEDIMNERQAVEVVSFVDERQEHHSQARSTLVKIYRSALFQIVVVSALAFCGPAMADAISGLGGGGAATPWAVSE
jgi:hypothetical protein